MLSAGRDEPKRPITGREGKETYRFALPSRGII